MAQTVLTSALEVGLFTVPVKLKKVSAKKDVTISNASPDGNPLGEQRIDKVTGELVAYEQIRKGVFDGDEFREIPAEALLAIEQETKIEGLSVDAFIPEKDVPYERVEDAYFLTPNGTAKPLKLLHDAMVKTKRVGVGKFVLRSRQKPFVVVPLNGGLFLLKLSFASDFVQAREAREALEGVEVAREQKAQAVQLVEALAGTVDALDAYEDDLVVLRSDLVQRALAGKKIESKKKAAKAAVAHDGLMESLKQSVEQAQKGRVKATA